MSLVHLSNTCSHLQNSSRARLSLTSIPHSRLHLAMALALQSAGFISSVVIGGGSPPPPHHLLSHPTPAPVQESISRPPPSSSSPSQPSQETSQPQPPQQMPTSSRPQSSQPSPPSTSSSSIPSQHQQHPQLTRENISTARLWLGLKYWNSSPVLERMSMISKPTRRIWMDVQGIKRLVLGKPSGMVPGLTKPGECLFVSTDRGVMESRDCVEKKVGGMLLCRVR